MGAVRLGRNYVRWCPGCNVPILEERECPLCGSRTEEVTVTPPGDVRPAFRYDIALIRDVVDRQFGVGCGEALVPNHKVVLLNKVPALDRMDEIIVDGQVAGALRYDLGRGWTFIARMYGAAAIAPSMSRGRVICDEGAIPFIRDGKNLMAPGVVEADVDILPGEEVVVLDREGTAIATGMARMTGEEMVQASRGLSVKNRWTSEPVEVAGGGQDWDLVLRANVRPMERRVAEAVEFILSTMSRNDLPAMVSFSGGKDSLATLLLTLDAGLRLPILFVDTGLEFPETVRHVEEVAERHGLRLMVERAPEGAFFDNLATFGPPGRDFRWCCKTNKLGPTVRAIMRNFPDGVLSFIGQRRFESEQRMSKPRVWKNPWTPGQVGASPIQEWNSLHVWMYILMRREDYNPWYERGLDRIGCFLCPASDMAELELVREMSGAYREWQERLDAMVRDLGLPQEWNDLALWRWRRVPPSIQREAESVCGRDVVAEAKERMRERSAEEALRMNLQEGISPCTLGYSIEGAFSRPLDLEATANVANMIGEVRLEEGEGWFAVGDVTVYGEGAFVAKGRSEAVIRERADMLLKVVRKASDCVGCGLCLNRCSEGALSLSSGRIRVDPSLCVHCGRCMEPCPATSFAADSFEM